MYLAWVIDMKLKIWMLAFFFTVITSLLIVYEATAAKVLQTNSATTANSEDNRLLSVAFVGGRCVYGLCRAEIVINRDRSYTFANGFNHKKAGILNQMDIADLTRQIDVADFNCIKSRKFQGTCPSASDRPEEIYTFYIQGRAEVVSACQNAIDLSSPLFSRVNQIIGGIRKNAY